MKKQLNETYQNQNEQIENRRSYAEINWEYKKTRRIYKKNIWRALRRKWNNVGHIEDTNWYNTNEIEENYSIHEQKLSQHENKFNGTTFARMSGVYKEILMDTGADLSTLHDYLYHSEKLTVSNRHKY